MLWPQWKDPGSERGANTAKVVGSIPVWAICLRAGLEDPSGPLAALTILWFCGNNWFLKNWRSGDVPHRWQRNSHKKNRNKTKKHSGTGTQLHPYIIPSYYPPERENKLRDMSTYRTPSQQSLCPVINNSGIYRGYPFVLPILALTTP